MANIFNVAKYILEKEQKITAMKLQKLCYYSQAWHLVWEETPLFNNHFEAWENGPVCPELYQWHKGQFIIENTKGLDSLCADDLLENEIETINCVLRDYKKYTAQQLSDLTHQEKPWKETYNKYRDFSGRCSAEIPLGIMHQFYSGLLNECTEN